MRDDFFCCGILLAAGQGKRFDPSGRQHKLLQVLPSGLNIVSTSASNLQQVFPQSWAVLADQSSAIQASLQALYFPTYFCVDAALGMAHSLCAGKGGAGRRPAEDTEQSECGTALQAPASA